jgi:hypothetical protein
MQPENRAFSLDRPSSQGLSLSEIEQSDDKSVNFAHSPTYLAKTKKIACGKMIKASVCQHIGESHKSKPVGFVPFPSRFKEMAKSPKKAMPSITTILPEMEDMTTKASGENSTLSLPRTPPHVRDGTRRHLWYPHPLL